MNTTSLEHLVLVPRSGLANRIRAIAAAKRLCQRSGARCTIVWDWQNYEALFESDPVIEVLSQIPPNLASTYKVMQTSMTGTEHRCVPLDGPKGIVLTSQHCFGAVGESKPLDEFDLLPWLPQPSLGVREKARLFRGQSFPAGAIVGFHMRRTDHKAAAILSPDWLFTRSAEECVGRGAAIYLATDNRDTEEMMRARFGNRIVALPKNPALAQRWPRPFNLDETIADYADLLLLASCDYVLGSADSSYSMLAMALNGSPNCRIARGLDAQSMSALDKVRGMQHRFRVLLFRLRQLARENPGLKFGPAILRALSARRASRT